MQPVLCTVDNVCQLVPRAQEDEPLCLHIGLTYIKLFSFWGLEQKPATLDQENLSLVSGWSNTLKPKSMPSALAVFGCRPNSHPFQERHVYLDEPVKIGRSVARCRPAQNNATFDCKVLSRNHALVWFDHKTGKVRAVNGAVKNSIC